MNVSLNERIHSTLIRVPLARGLLTECIEYRNVKVLVEDLDYRAGLSREDNQTLANEICSNNQFTCQTGVAIGSRLTRCIDNILKCNRIVNCEDKSDETTCPENFRRGDREFSQCSTGYEECQDGKLCYRKNETTCGMMRQKKFYNEILF